MSEEEQKYFKGLIGFTFDSDDIKYIEKIVDKKDKEIERLNNIINKAIEYIKYWHYRNDFRVNSFTLDVKEDLLNILQGSDKEC